MRAAAAAGAGLRIVSKTNEARVEVWGREAIVHSVGMPIASPSQVAIGENFAEMGLTARRFTGQLRVISKTVEERR